MSDREDLRIGDRALAILAANPRFYPDEQYSFRELIALRAANLKLRDKLLEVAAECTGCHGTGLITRHFLGNEDRPAWDADDQICESCADIRAVLDE